MCWFRTHDKKYAIFFIEETAIKHFARWQHLEIGCAQLRPDFMAAIFWHFFALILGSLGRTVGRPACKRKVKVQPKITVHQHYDYELYLKGRPIAALRWDAHEKTCEGKNKNWNSKLFLQVRRKLCCFCQKD